MKKSLLKFASVLLLALSVAGISKADYITGRVDISQFGSTAAVDFGAQTVSFSPTTANAQVAFTSGAYNGLLGSSVTYSGFSYSGAAGTQTLWSLVSDSLTHFDLTSVTVQTVTPGVGLSLWGNGIAYLDGYTPTWGSWTFSSSTVTGSTTFNFSSTNTSVPDGGTTALLVGLGLVGMSVVARRRK